MSNKHKIVVAITGASGSLYARNFLKKLEKLGSQIETVSLVMSDNARDVWKHELGDEGFLNLPFQVYGKQDFNAPFASGSAKYTAMVIIPCSMGTLARVAGGISNDLTTRAADVMLKERRKLILVTREMPLSLIHINNMKTVTEAGGIICPASPSFYSKPADMESLAGTVSDRVIDLIGLEQSSYRWNEK